MELKIMNSNEELIGIIDEYKSLIWTRRYYECGDFELYCKATSETLALLRTGNFVARDDDEQICIIEKIQVTTDVENGNYITAFGRCMKSILDRRIVWYQTTLYAQIETLIQIILDKNLINPSNTDRTIPNFTFENTGTLTDYVEMQMDGDTIYDVIISVCKQFKYGFAVALKNGVFTLKLYKGKDRSYAQTENPYVVFSTDFDNLTQSTYIFNNADYKNVALVKGEGSGNERGYYTVGSATGLERRETFTDAQSISTNNGAISESNYYQLLSATGNRALSSMKGSENLEGTIIETGQYEYKKDYFLGDVVQIKNEYGVEAQARIIEIIESDDDTGNRLIPTFSTWEVTPI